MRRPSRGTLLGVLLRNFRGKVLHPPLGPPILGEEKRTQRDFAPLHAVKLSFPRKRESRIAILVTLFLVRAGGEHSGNFAAHVRGRALACSKTGILIPVGKWYHFQGQVTWGKRGLEIE